MFVRGRIFEDGCVEPVVEDAATFGVSHCLLFFFSSRRRHTRCLSDWSSDVCSSDLGNILVTAAGEPKILDFGVARATDADVQMTAHTEAGDLIGTLGYMSPEQVGGEKIGRASCRERGEVWGGDGAVNTQKTRTETYV